MKKLEKDVVWNLCTLLEFKAAIFFISVYTKLGASVFTKIVVKIFHELFSGEGTLLFLPRDRLHFATADLT